MTTSLSTVETDALKAIAQLARDDGRHAGLGVPMTAFVRSMGDRGYTAEDAVAALDELVNTGKIELSSHYRLINA